jgi:CHAD domain-containing protein
MIKNFFKGLWSGITSLFSAADTTFVGVFEFIDKIETAVNTSKTTLEELKKFDFDPKFKTRVVSIPRAIEAFQQLWDEITKDLLEKFHQLANQFQYWRGKFESPTPTEGAEAAAPITAKLQDLHTMLQQIGDSLQTIIDIENIVTDVKTRIETLDDLFLPQNKPRKWLTEPTYKRV